ncbi:unnamed protein product, partial [Didymodactylos carnosus]
NGRSSPLPAIMHANPQSSVVDKNEIIDMNPLIFCCKVLNSFADII